MNKLNSPYEVWVRRQHLITKMHCIGAIVMVGIILGLAILTANYL